LKAPHGGEHCRESKSCEDSTSKTLESQIIAALRGTHLGGWGFRSCRLGAKRGRHPMDEQMKTEIWDLAAGTFIAVSVVSGMAYIIATAVH
jgi:hypothetical protein